MSKLQKLQAKIEPYLEMLNPYLENVKHFLNEFLSKCTQQEIMIMVFCLVFFGSLIVLMTFYLAHKYHRWSWVFGGVIILILIVTACGGAVSWSYHDAKVKEQHYADAAARKKQLAADLQRLAEEAKKAREAEETAKEEEPKNLYENERKQYIAAMTAIETSLDAALRENDKKQDAVMSRYNNQEIDNFDQLVAKSHLEIERQTIIIKALEEKTALVQGVNFADETEKAEALKRLSQRKALAQLSLEDYKGILRDVQAHSAEYRNMDY